MAHGNNAIFFPLHPWITYYQALGELTIKFCHGRSLPKHELAQYRFEDTASQLARHVILNIEGPITNQTLKDLNQVALAHTYKHTGSPWFASPRVGP